MKSKLFVFQFSFLIFLLVMISSSGNTITPETESTFVENRINSPYITSFDYVPSVPIIILFNENFSDYGFAGTGIASDPYIIENLNVTTWDNYGIYIMGTTAHFVIRDCYLNSQQYGILLSHVHNADLIFNCVLDDNNVDGIHLDNVYNCHIENNICQNNNIGIYLTESYYSYLRNNTCINNHSGIEIHSSGDIIIESNSCRYSTSYGVGCYLSDNCDFLNNLFYSNYDCLALYYSDNCMIRNNTFEDSYTALRLQISYSCQIEKNYCDSNEEGLYLLESRDNYIYNNTFKNGFTGIRMEYGRDNEFVLNRISNNEVYGIQLLNSRDCEFTINMCYENNVAIYLSSCQNNLFIQNTFGHNTGFGMYIDSDSSNNIIHHNDFSYNNLLGKKQAWDDGRRNEWFDKDTKQGNYWLDLKKCIYYIEGDAWAKDKYPLNRSPECPNPNLIISLSFVLPLVSVLGISTFLIIKFFIPYYRNTLRLKIIASREKRSLARAEAAKSKLPLCSKCKKPLNIQDDFCTNCGASMTESVSFSALLLKLENRLMVQRISLIILSLIVIGITIYTGISECICIFLFFWLPFALPSLIAFCIVLGFWIRNHNRKKFYLKKLEEKSE